MALRHYPGKDQTWLTARLNEILDEEADGKTVTQAGAGDVNSTSSVQFSIGERKRRVLWDLAQVNPEGDWLSHIPKRITRAVFNDR